MKKIAAALKTSFQDFKDDKDVKDMLTLEQRSENNGIAKGIDIGRAEGIDFAVEKALELIKKGIDPEAALLEMKRGFKETV